MIQILLPPALSPHFYAAAEEWMLRNIPPADYFFTYINSPCVVVGKNQSLWRELNWEYIYHHPEKIVRRISGGGTVYHDSGNICFGFFSPFEEKKVNNYRWFNKSIVDSLHKMDIATTFSPRNDLLLDDKKISGNAQFTDRKIILSHGTLLFKSDIEALRFALQKNDFEIDTKAVSSVRSTVMNIAQKTQLDLDSFYSRLIGNLPIKERIALSENQLAEIIKLQQDKYETIAWIFGQSPKTLVSKKDISFSIENGLFYALSYPTHLAWLQKIEGVFFHPHTIQKTLQAEGWSAEEIASMLNYIFV